MKRQVYILAGLFIVVMTLWSMSADAIMPGAVKEYTGSPMGKVTFTSDTHVKNAGLTCTSCHPKFFSTKDFKVTMEDHKSGAKCFNCHNDTIAPKTCTWCHKK